jgi:hypothetical protein
LRALGGYLALAAPPTTVSQEYERFIAGFCDRWISRYLGGEQTARDLLFGAVPAWVNPITASAVASLVLPKIEDRELRAELEYLLALRARHLAWATPAPGDLLHRAQDDCEADSPLARLVAAEGYPR